MTRIVLVVLCLTACAIDPYQWERVEVIETTRVTWRQVDNVISHCSAILGPGFWGGCAVWNENECTFFTASDPSVELIGHEVKHCFGYRH